ncbi:SDR family oxidoreductase [Roseitalea porphyridii]|uniref:SDR family oxidoreductase n=1 Tax=Roseitalea porphyridii TaxID=1852022 RepID=A0A4V1A3U2_9HYPH|nr:SDR family oxidoreductase [Roseitalea porphyridii]QBK30308.1 SDR family oxidoreductase [Roseitalea porphyridii]
MADYSHDTDKPAALVTGGAKRIGKAIVTDLARHGHAVAIHANHSAEAAEALAGEIEAGGGRAMAVTADLTDADASRTLVGKAADALGLPVRLAVNSASIFEDDAIGALDETTWDTHFAIHVRAPVLIAEAVAGALPEGRQALIVNMIDQRVWKLTPRFFSYTLSKSTLWTATRTMAQALAPAVRVNAIGPGPTLKNPRQSDADFNAQTDALLLERGPDLAEFGATIRYLWAARSVTGQMIALDGGQHLAWETPDATGAE